MISSQFKDLLPLELQSLEIINIETIQELWSGYGSIKRYTFANEGNSSIIVKEVNPQTIQDHPRGWNTDRSRSRKLQSYQIESNWYQNYNSTCRQHCRIPIYLNHYTDQDKTFLMMEDLNEAGFSTTLKSCSFDEAKPIISWLASFHGGFLGEKSNDLWLTGTYWHLATREDEWNRLDSSKLKDSAYIIDQKLIQCRHFSLVHGDAKLANFCFSDDRSQVAAVDFQYVGGGCGIKDLVCFISSCFQSEDCFELESEILDFYFNALHSKMRSMGTESHFLELESEWRDLYPWAWADFVRFLKGWSPNHWKLHDYSLSKLDEVLRTIP